MGKEDKGRQLKREAEVESVGHERKERRGEGLDEKMSERGQGRQQDREEEESTIDRAIEEMLTECQRHAFERGGASYDYDLGSELGGYNQSLSPLGRGGEARHVSQPEVRSKQSAGMGRGQRQSPGSATYEDGTGEVLRSSQFACSEPSRLDLKPCRGEELVTEHGRPTPWQTILPCACGEKESSWRELCPALSQSMEVLSKTTRCGQSTEGIFPLPLPGDLGWCNEEDPMLESLVRGLNSLYGVESGEQGSEENSGKAEGGGQVFWFTLGCTPIHHLQGVLHYQGH